MRAWLNVGEAAEYAGVCKDTIYSACERNELRHARIGGRRCSSFRGVRVSLSKWANREIRLQAKAGAVLDEMRMAAS